MIFNHKEEPDLQRAVQFATKAHGKQFRKDSASQGVQLPYIVHPLEVMRVVYSFGITKPEWEYILVAAVLHDIIEDTEYNHGTLTDMFGERVTKIVQELSFRDKLADEPSHEYQKAKSEHLGEFASKSLEALLIKVADRICNVRDFAESDFNYAKKYYNRADGLWSAFALRAEDIKQHFGEGVQASIQQQIAALTRLLYP